MTRRLLSSASALAIVLFAAAAQAGYLQGFERTGSPPILPPRVHVETLPNGITCFLLEDHTLPLVQMSVIARGGAINDPVDRVGQAELAGILMRSGGAGERSPEDFDAAVDGLGAVLSSGFGAEMGEFGVEVLSEDTETGLRLLFDMLFRPRFDPARLKIAKLKIEEKLRRENDDPDLLAGRTFSQLVYGASSPWARRPNRTTLAHVDVPALRAFHAEALKTGNLLLAAAGDFRTRELLALIRALTADAPSGVADFPSVPEVPLAFSPATENIVRPLTQSFIRMGHLGIRRFNPDRFALALMTEILGASNFKSRLMEDIRTQRGMAYSIWSSISSGTDYGLFLVGVDTKAKQASEVIELIRNHIETLARGGEVTPEEIDFARRSILTRLVFEFDSAFKTVGRRVTFRFYGYPDDYWRIYRDRIAGVTRADIRAAAPKYLHPEGLKIVVVGPKTP